MQDLAELVREEAKRRNTTVKGLSQIMKFKYSVYSQYVSWGYTTINNYYMFRELFPDFRDEEVEKQLDQRKTTIVRPKRVTKRDYALNWVERILSQEEKTVLPQYFLKDKNAIIKEMGNRGIEIEIYKRVFEGENAIGGKFGGEQGEEVFSIRRLNG